MCSYHFFPLLLTNRNALRYSAGHTFNFSLGIINDFLQYFELKYFFSNKFNKTDNLYIFTRIAGIDSSAERVNIN